MIEQTVPIKITEDWRFDKREIRRNETRKVFLSRILSFWIPGRIPRREGKARLRRAVKGEVGSEIGRESWYGVARVDGGGEEDVRRGDGNFCNGSCLYERPFPVVRLDEIARKTTF